MIRPCSNLSTLFEVDSWFDPVRLMIRPWSTHDSTVFDSIDPSTHDSALFASSLDPVWPMIRLCWLYYSFDRRKLRRKTDSVWLMIRPCSTYDSNVFDSWFDRVWLYRPFDSWFGPVRIMIRPCLTLSTLFDSWFDCVRPCSTHDSALFASWFDRVRLMVRPCSTLSTLYDSWFDPVWPMIRLCWLYFSFDRRKLRRKSDSVWLIIRPCSTHDSTLFDSIDPVRLMIRLCSTVFDSWFGPVRIMIRPCSTHGSTLFDSIDPVRLMIRPCLTHDLTFLTILFVRPS